MTWYVYWNVIIVQAHDFPIVRPICQNNLESTIKYSGVLCLSYYSSTGIHSLPLSHLILG